MSRLNMLTPDRAQTVVESLYRDVERRIDASPPGLCPVDLSAAFLRLCHAQTCGKCVPCRVGLGQLLQLLDDVLDGKATLDTINLIEKTARVIKDSADCAIGFEAAAMVLKGILGFREDFEEHILHHRCQLQLNQPVPCVAMCPAGVDIPGYISLVAEERCEDAIRLIRKDNPFPAVCALVCEHPCESRCRRNMVDDAINIRALKRYAVEKAGRVPAPACAPATGKKVAVIGGGPGGLSAAYFLSLMGHSVTVFEKRKYLGGMLSYGIPSYRLPAEKLIDDIEVILSTGVEVRTKISIGRDVTFDQLREEFDSIYISIGAHVNKRLGIEGEDKRGVIFSVEMPRRIDARNRENFEGKNVVVIGGGNVAMDCTRTAKRLGAASVTCVYRRRQVDMVAQPDEIEGAIAEGCRLMTLHAPVRIEYDAFDMVNALWVQPQIVGKLDAAGRPTTANAKAEEVRLPCDIIVVAIGSGVETLPFESQGVPIRRGTIDAGDTSSILNMEGVFAGGDCVTGPASVIRAIAAGKVAAANIDEYLGFNHVITADVDIPDARMLNRAPQGRVNTMERPALERSQDFEHIEYNITDQEAHQESRRCLRCDHFGFGVFKGGRTKKW